MRILIGILTLILGLTAAFAGGWQVESWHYGSERAGEYKKSIDSQREAFAAALKNQQTMDKNLADLNSKSQSLQTSLDQLLEKQNHGFASIYYKIGHLSLGVCRFTPAADELFRQAYDTALGEPDVSGPAKTHSASVEHGPHHQAGRAQGHARPAAERAGDGGAKAVH